MKALDSTDHDDSFLLDLEPSERQTSHDALSRVAYALGSLPSAPATRARVLEGLRPADRFARFEEAVAELLGLTREDAAAALARIDDPSAWIEQAPGIALLPVKAGPASGLVFAFSGFIRVLAGTAFPQHEHLGEETTLVLQGAFHEDSANRRYGPGEPAHMPTGTRHGFVVPADGPHLVGLVALRTGLVLM